MIIYTAKIRVTVPTPAGGLTVNLQSTTTYYFKKLQERIDFVATCCDIGVEVLKLDIEVTITSEAALRDVLKEKAALVRAFKGRAA